MERTGEKSHLSPVNLRKPELLAIWLTSWRWVTYALVIVSRHIAALLFADPFLAIYTLFYTIRLVAVFAAGFCVVLRNHTAAFYFVVLRYASPALLLACLWHIDAFPGIVVAGFPMAHFAPAITGWLVAAFVIATAAIGTVIAVDVFVGLRGCSVWRRFIRLPYLEHEHATQCGSEQNHLSHMISSCISQS